MPSVNFKFKKSQLYCEDVACAQIARAVGTPCYVYSRAQITAQYLHLAKILPRGTKIFYAVKANSNLAILRLLKNLGASFDVVSLGEMQRVLRVGACAENIVFSGVGKSRAELEFAIKAQIHGIHVESSSELRRIIEIAQCLQLPANIAIRVNPDIDIASHPYISTGLHNNKFGVNFAQALELYALASQVPLLKVVGIACHLGSQIQSVAPYLEAVDLLLKLRVQLQARGITVNYMDIGGGMSIAYHEDDLVFDINKFGVELNKVLAQHPDLTLHVEPGRFIVGNAGVLLTRVEYLKDCDQKKFLIIDAAMNDLIRPCLYQSLHSVINTQVVANSLAQTVDIVGPICESADFIVKDYTLAASQGDLLAIEGCGAYAASMASNYNSRPRAPEILVDGDTYSVVRARETLDNLFALESF